MILRRRQRICRLQKTLTRDQVQTNRIRNTHLSNGESTTSSKETATRFKPVLGRLSATAVSIGGIIGSGIFFILGMAAGDAGPAVILSLVMAGVIAIFTAMSFASLGSKIQKEGGEYQFVYIAFGPQIGFIGGLFWVGSTAIAAITVSIAFAGYFTTLFPILSPNIIAAMACIGFMLIDVMGIRLSSLVNNALVAVKVSVLVFFIVWGLFFVQPSNFQPFFGKGAGGILSAAFLIFFAYAGFGKITAASEEVKDAKKNVPWAILAAISVCTVLYIFSGFVAIGVAGADRLSSPEFSGAPFAHVMQLTGFGPAFLVVAIGALTATASVLLIQMLGISRTIYGMTSNRQMPSFLGKLHPRFRTPYRAEIIIGVLMAFGALVLSASSVVSLTSLGILSYYALINLASLRIKMENGSPHSSYVVSILGFVSSTLLVLYFLWTTFT